MIRRLPCSAMGFCLVAAYGPKRRLTTAVPASNASRTTSRSASISSHLPPVTSQAAIRKRSG